MDKTIRVSQETYDLFEKVKGCILKQFEPVTFKLTQDAEMKLLLKVYLEKHPQLMEPSKPSNNGLNQT
jgi:hypothetical protein